MLAAVQPPQNRPSERAPHQAAAPGPQAASKAAFVWVPAEVKSNVSQTPPQARGWGRRLVVIEAAVTINVAVDTVLLVGDFS